MSQSLNAIQKYRLVLLGLVCLLKLSTLWAQRPGWWHITDEDGLPGQTIYNGLQDKDGFIWLGTNNGLCRFDGREFTVYSAPSMADQEILRMSIGPRGRLWFINLARQLFYLEGDSIHRLDQEGFSENIQILHHWFDDDKLWTQTSNKGILIMSRLHLPPNGPPILEKVIKLDRLLKKRNKMISLAPKQFISTGDTSLQLSIVDDIIGIDVFTEDSYHFHQVDISKQSIDRKDFHLLKPFLPLLTHNYSHLYLINEQGGIQSIANPRGRKWGDILTINREKWMIDSKEGIYVFKQGHQLSSRFQSLNINYAFEDRENNTWLCTDNDGIYMILSPNIRYHNKSTEGLPGQSVHSILDAGDEVFIGQDYSWLTSFVDGNPSRSLELPVGNSIRSIVKTKEDKLVIGTDYSLAQIDLRDLSVLPSPLVVSAPKELILDKKGNIIVASSAGVYTLWKEDLPKLHQQKESRHRIAMERSYALAADAQNRIWVGSIHGLYYMENHKQMIPVPLESLPFLVNITDLLVAPDGSLWVATHQHGVLQLEGTKVVQHYTVDQGLSSNNCRVIYLAGDQLWIGTNKGINMLNTRTQELKVIDTKSGLPSNEINQLLVKDEEVWAGTPGGLAIFPTSELDVQPPPPPISIQKLLVNGESMPTENVQLSHLQNNLNIHFLGLAYKSKGKEQYRYRLLGLDTSWTFSNSREVTFHTLPPGVYKFQVQTINHKGLRSIEAASLPFTIHQAWWRKGWFILSSVLLLMSISGWVIYWRQKSIRKKEMAENRLKQKINRLRVQALQAQMNPHFVFNALNAIQNYLLTNDTDRAVEYLSYFAKMIAFIFEYSGRKSITLEKELEFLGHYLKLEKLRFEDKVTIDFVVEDSLLKDKADVYLPPLLIQPIVENAFKHGLYHKLEKGKLKIEFVPSDKSQFKCTIEDDGIGREEAARFSHFHPKERESSSLKITLERLNLLHNANPKDYFCVTDLKNTKQQPIGTRVEIWI
ncbi:MAG: histidine kinase [Bacteroidota bacterium]